MVPVSPLQATPKSCCRGSCFCCPGTFPPPTRGSGHKRLKNVLGQRSVWHCTWLIWIYFSNRRMLFAFSLPLLQALRVKKQPPPSRAVTLWARTRVRAPTSGLPSPLPAGMEQLHLGILLPGSLGVTLHTSALLYFTEKGERVLCICRETRPRAGFSGSQPWCERTCSEPRCVGHLGCGWWKQTAVLGVQRASLRSQRCFRAGLGAALLPGEQELGTGLCSCSGAIQPAAPPAEQAQAGSGHKAVWCTAPP